MVFSSLEFLTVFLPLVALFYFIFPKKLRNGLLLVFSLVFYAWGEPVYVLIMLASITANYFFGLGVDAWRERPKRQKTVLVLSVIFNLGLLGFFKYTDFILKNINGVFRTSLPMANIALPIGISFFTFQAMSYVIDVYRRDASVQKNPLNFGLYISLFPQLIAGPIVRYQTVADQIVSREVNFDMAAAGVRRFITGLGKKVLLANNAGLIWEQISALDMNETAAATVWFGFAGFALQVYFDFSGYSDMAIGLGQIFGFRFLENFDYPFISADITEFWRRWHISLGTWFREYVYIPLGGNRKGKARQIFNIAVVWFLTGLWHGANWNYVMWGLYFGLWLILEKFVLRRVLDRLPKALRHVYAMSVLWFSWAVFLFESPSAFFDGFRAMFFAHGFADGTTLYYFTSNIVLVLIAFFASLPVGKRLAGKLEAKLTGSRETKAASRQALWTALELVWYLAVLTLSLAFLVDSTYNPFIYFRF